jgi:hypothetical protein
MHILLILLPILLKSQSYADPVRFAAYLASHAFSAGHVAYSARFASYPTPPVTILLVLFPILLVPQPPVHPTDSPGHLIANPVDPALCPMSYAKPISFAACPGPACLSCSLSCLSSRLTCSSSDYSSLTTIYSDHHMPSPFLL